MGAERHLALQVTISLHELARIATTSINGPSALTCTGLVTQAREHCGDVVGDGGFGVELLAAGDADGDVLQGA